MMNIASPAFHANPHPFYRQLRDEAPVHRITLPDKRTLWLLTRYDDVATLLRDERFVKSPANVPCLPGEKPVKEPWMPAFIRPLAHNMLDQDGADHTRLRNLVHRVFTPKLIEQMRQEISQITQRLIDSALHASRANGGMVDLLQQVALPLPVTVIAKILGVYADDYQKFARWAAAFVGNTNMTDMLLSIPSLWQLMRYLRNLIAERRANPRDDLITALVQAQDNDDQLNDDEVLAMVVILLTAGFETTVNLISSGVLALLQHPDQWAMLRDAVKGRTANRDGLLRSTVEELVRYTSPVSLGTERYATTEITLHGVTIPRGAFVGGAIISANYDERRFAQPDVLNLMREDNRHLGFGNGVHYCLGAPLARLEVQIALAAIVEQMPNLRLAVPVSQLRWRKSLIIRGLKALPVVNPS